MPPDRRVALLPEQCRAIGQQFPGIELFVQPSPIRCVSDEAYNAAGIELREDLTHCDVLLGIKEVPILQLIPEKTYFFFSHTFKKQPYNRQLLQTILQRNITLIDYECLTDSGNPPQRIIAFGKFAGIVGAYNVLWTYGKRNGLYDLKRAYTCLDRAEMRAEYEKIKLPPVKIVVTGTGRVGKGAMEVLDEVGIRQVSPEELLHETFREPVYVALRSQDYHRHKDGLPWNKQDFHQHPQDYESTFAPFTKAADLLITTAYWHPQAPRLFTRYDAQRKDFRMKVIADISCDVNGSVPATVRTSTILEPVYDYDPDFGEVKKPFSGENHLTVMAIDNLPCELPYDASQFFGNQLMEQVLPHLLNGDKHTILARATIAHNGQLTGYFSYLSDFVAEGVENGKLL